LRGNSRCEHLSEKGKKVRLVLMADSHGHHRDVDVPDGDLLIHAGDFTLFNGSTFAIRDFNEWLGGLPHKTKILIPGNHDSGLIYPEWRELITNAVLLINKETVIDGLRIWGSPVTPNDWGVFGPDTPQERQYLYAGIPNNTDILITHGPPFGILDRGTEPNKPQGCRELLDAVRRVRPQLHVFGHVHEGYGTIRSHGTLFVNAALAGSGHDLTVRQPITISIHTRIHRSGCLSPVSGKGET